MQFIDDFSRVAGASNLTAMFGKLAQAWTEKNTLELKNKNNKLNHDFQTLKSYSYANTLRDNYLETLGENIAFNARKNLKTSSPMYARAWQKSAQNLGQDIQTLYQNLDWNKQQYLTQNALNKLQGKTDFITQIYHASSYLNNAVENFFLQIQD